MVYISVLARQILSVKRLTRVQLHSNSTVEGVTKELRNAEHSALVNGIDRPRGGRKTSCRHRDSDAKRLAASTVGLRKTYGIVTKAKCDLPGAVGEFSDCRNRVPWRLWQGSTKQYSTYWRRVPWFKIVRVLKD